MGFTNIYAKYLIAGLLLCASVCSAQVSTTTIPGQLKINKVPNTIASGDSTVIIDAAGNIKKIAKGVQSVIGTTNRITSTGGLNPVIDISASYIGQSSITTLGTIISGVWHGTAIGDTWIASAATWNAKQNALTLVSTGISGGPSGNSGYATFNSGTATLDIPKYVDDVQVTVAGTVSGTAIFAQPIQGNAWKKVIVYCSNLTGDAAYMYPFHFMNTPIITTVGGLPSSVVTSITTLGVTVTGSSTTGYVTIEGW